MFLSLRIKKYIPLGNGYKRSSAFVSFLGQVELKKIRQWVKAIKFLVKFVYLNQGQSTMCINLIGRDALCRL